MRTVVRLNKWANAHTNFMIDALRVAIGLFLVYKGIQFISETQYLEVVLGPIGKSLGASYILVHYVAMSHLCGGLLIALGLLTRISLLAQLPILIGAIVVNFVGVMDVGNLIQATVVLILAFFFVFYGSGKHSMDYSLKMNV